MPRRLPVASDVKFTENGTVLKLGEGLWGTANGLGKFRLYTDDPAEGEVGFIGVVHEWDRPAILVLRLKIVDKKIAEIETIVNRDIPGATALDKIGTPDPRLTATVAEAERESREELIKVSNRYFADLERSSGNGANLFTADCNRIEGGTQTTNNPAIDASRPYSYPIFGMGCEGQFKTGFFKFVTRIRDRRFMVVDRERGLVFRVRVFRSQRHGEIDHDDRRHDVSGIAAASAYVGNRRCVQSRERQDRVHSGRADAGAIRAEIGMGAGQHERASVVGRHAAEAAGSRGESRLRPQVPE